MTSYVNENMYNNPRPPSFLIVRCLLFFGILISPFTALRFGILGVGELCFLAAIISYLLINRGLLRVEYLSLLTLGFWMPFIGISFLGMCYHLLFLEGAHGTIATSVFDLLSYIFITSLLCILGDIRVFGDKGAVTFFFKAHSCLVTALIILYILSLFTPTLFGIQLRYYHYFAPLVDNLHQISMIACVLPFVSLAFWKSRRTISSKVFIFLSLPFLCLMAFESGSSKAAIGVIAGISISLLLIVVRSIFGRVSKLIILLLGAGLLAYATGQRELFTQFFNDIDGGGARAILYAKALLLILESPLVGYGPGPHILAFGGPRDFSDAHNSILTIGLQAGLPGIVLLVILLVRLTNRGFFSPWLIGALASFSVYLSGGDILRRVPIWIILSMIVYLSQRAQKSGSF